MSEIKYIASASYKDALAATIESLRARKVDLSEKHYVFVPDRYTLFAEREICSGIGGAFDVEILTFNRLFSKFFRGKSYLPRHGAVMLLKSVIDDVKKDLGCFSRSAEFKGFAEKLYDAIKLLSECRISPADLENGGAIKTKLNDIRLLYSEYCERTRGKHVDAIGRGELLISEIASRDFTGVHLYFPMHGEFNRQEKEVVNLMCRTAASCVKYCVTGAPEKFGKTEFYVSSDVTCQLKAAAKRIRFQAKNGVPYEKIGVIAPQTVFGQAERIFTEFDIPFYIDKKIELGAQALPQFVERLYNVVTGGYATDDFIALSKNAYCGADKLAADEFENYCLKYRIDYLGFFEPFTRGETSERENPEKVRALLAGKVRKFENSFKSVACAEDFRKLVFDLTDGKDVAETTARLGSASGIDLSAVPEKMRATAELAKEVWGEKNVKATALFETFFEGLAAGRISPIPKECGTVEIGDGNAFIASDLEYVFIIGAEEGVMPPLMADCAVITDKDMDIMRDAGVTLEPKISELNKASDEGFLHSAASGKNLFVGCAESAEKGSFAALAAIWAGSAEKSENSPEKEAARLDSTRSAGYSAFAARHCSTVGNATEMYLISRAKIAAGGKGLPFHAELKTALEESGVSLSENSSFDEYGLRQPHDIFFYKNSTTISRVQDYFACPYKNFLKNAVRLKERESGCLEPVDVGTFLHRVAELFVATGEFENPDDAIERSIKRTLEENEKYVLDANKPFVARIADEARKVSRIIAAQITSGSFESLGQEMRFGFGDRSDLKTLEIDARGRKISLRGIIDRVDLYGDYARVIDYKTGSLPKGKFDFSRLYYGKKIQLMLYMKILEENGYLPAGMFYFPFSVAWDDDEFSHRLSGVYNDDEDIVTALDNALGFAGAKSIVINARRKKSGDGFTKNNYAFSTENLKKLADYAFKVLEKAAEEIVSGETGRSPSAGECKYCPYGAICRADENSVAERVQPNVDSDTIIEAVDLCGGGR